MHMAPSLCIIHVIAASNFYSTYLYSTCISAVTGQSNFSMERTSLTTGGFTQPGVDQSIIESHIVAERGFLQRFLWIFLIFGHLRTLKAGSQYDVRSCVMRCVATQARTQG